jgi:hypothetical protein
MPGFSSLIRLIAVFALLLGGLVANGSAATSIEPEPTVASDKADYAPGSTVILTGAGWTGDTSVHLSVNDTLGKTWQREVDVPVDGSGNISDSFVLPTTFVAEYDVMATGLETGRTATTTFTDSSADIDQCANGGVGDPPESCNNAFPANWVNGNLVASKSHYFEGDSIPYRIKMDGLVDNSTDNKIIFAWDVTKDSKHAIDYLTSFDRTVTDANPCTSVAGCILASETNFAIPLDPTLTFTPIAGSFSMFGGTITSAAPYGASPGNDDCPAGTLDFVGTDTRCIELTFTATETNPVLAWGGHIASRQNWGAGNAAVNIPGSPFHTSLVALNGSGGNQDRSLSNDAVIFPATIKIIKHTVPPTSTSFGFTGSPLPVTNFSLTDNSAVTDAEQSFTLDSAAEFTAYTITEDAAPGYALSSISCSVTDGTSGSSTTSLANRRVIIDIKEGESRTCTFTNDLQTGTLTVIKHVVNDDGGAAAAGNWSIHVKSGVNEVTGSPQNGVEAPGTTYTLNAGTYDVSETGGPSGYSFDGFTGDCNLSGSVTVVAGQNRTCTLTNNDNPPQLKLVKTVTNDDGGGAVADDWTLSATAAAPNDGRNFNNLGGSGTFQNVFAGVAYTLAETPNPGTGYSSDGQWSCDGGTMSAGNTVVAVPLGAQVTCTITNTDNTPQLKLVKSVVNNDGGTKVADDWNLSATAAAPNDGRNFNNTGGSGAFQNVFAGVAYTLAENPNPGTGYSSTGEWSCPGGAMSAGNTVVTVPLGGVVTCTITNTDNTPQLKLVKSVLNNDGGTKVADDWNLSATADAPDDGRNFSNDGGSGAFENVFAGVTYALAETPNAGTGYSTTGLWSCDGGTMSVGNTSVTVGLGAQVTCTITNADQTPQLKLIKSVLNNDGGTKVADDWTLSATAAAPNDGRNFSNAGGSGVFQNVFAGAAYTLAESPNPGTGYSSSGQWSCDGGTMSAGNTVVTVALGAQVTCTITNTDNTPQLKLVKSVVNNDGGGAVADDWSLSATADAPNDGRNFSNAGGSGVFQNVFAGVTYALAETPNAGTGYSSTGQWSCDGGTMSVGNTSVTVALGAQVTCTITNTDNTPQLKLVKSVLNNDGGTKVADDWTLSATAAAPDNGRNFSNAGGSGAFQNVFAGAAYTLAENPNPGTGYSSSGQWSCDGGTMSAGNTVVTVPLGVQVTCTITNTDNTPTLKLVKNVSGGSATPNSFTLAAAAPVPNNGRNFSNLGGSGSFQNVFANATYTLSETGPAGYTPSAWSCDGGIQVGATIQVPLGAAVTCTITNTRDRGTITAIKYHDLNADGTFAGDPVLSNWTLFVDLDKTGTLTANDLSGSTDASGSVSFPGLETTVNGATYWVCEVLQANWVNSDPGAGSVTANGKCKAVTVTKDQTTTVRLGNFQRIKIQVNKTLDQLPVPAGRTFQFSIRKDASTNPAGVNGGFGTVIANGSVTGPDGTITSAEWAVVAGQQYPLNPGTYQLCESIVEGLTPHWTQGVYGVDWFSPGIQAAGGFQEAENTLVCINFTVVSGDGGADNTVEFNVDNVTRGFSHTIGFWKNWTSCDGRGGQFAMLDLMITGGTRNGITYQGADDSNGNGLRDIRIGNLYIEGPNACKIAVDLLDKRPVGDPAKLGDKAKASSDPVYNSVSQLVAFELNQLLNATGTGSAACQAKATGAARLMQRFLTYIDFRRTASNSTYTMPSNKTRVKQIRANLLYLANVIDDYNNNTIGGCAAALALPYPTVAGTNPLQTWAAFLPAYTDT